MYFNENEILRIKSASDGRLLDVVQDFRELRKSGKDYVCECPKCRSAKKFTVSPGKNLFKCFSCQIGGEGAVSYLMNIEGYGYTDALEYLAKKFCVLLDPHPDKPAGKPVQKMKKGSKAAKGLDTGSYCARMLAASGLTFEDVTASVYKTDDTKSVFQCRTFKPGTIDERGMLTAKGDDVIIEYYDLDGLPVR